MTVQPADLYDVLLKLRYDLTSMQGKVTDALNILRELHLPDQPTADCPSCGLSLRGQRTLAEHLHVSHDGPVPDHWLEIEARSVEPDQSYLVKTREGDEEPDLEVPT